LPFTADGQPGAGGGVIQVDDLAERWLVNTYTQTSASECILVSLLAARAETLREMKKRFPFVEEGVLLSRMMAYCSKVGLKHFYVNYLRVGSSLVRWKGVQNSARQVSRTWDGQTFPFTWRDAPASDTGAWKRIFFNIKKKTFSGGSQRRPYTILRVSLVRYNWLM
jgi:hypothetical protein